MKIIRPITITPSEFVSSTAVETSPAYAAGTTYALGAYVLYGQRIYESLQASNLNHTPGVAGSETWWLDIGPGNVWAMFDQINGTKTSATTSLETVLTIAPRVNSLAFLEVSASQINVIAEFNSEEIYNQTFDLVDQSEVVDWYGYFFSELQRHTELIVDDLPNYSDMTIRTTLTGETGTTVSLGGLVVGTGRYLGMTLSGARVGLIDFSRKEVDDFGNYTLIERAFSRRGNFTVIVEGESTEDVANQVDSIHRLLGLYRATPLVWVGDDSYGSTAIFGFYRSFEVDIAYPTHSVLSLEIEGLT